MQTIHSHGDSETDFVSKTFDFNARTDSDSDSDDSGAISGPITITEPISESDWAPEMILNPESDSGSSYSELPPPIVRSTNV